MKFVKVVSFAQFAKELHALGNAFMADRDHALTVNCTYGSISTLYISKLQNTQEVRIEKRCLRKGVKKMQWFDSVSNYEAALEEIDPQNCGCPCDNTHC